MRIANVRGRAKIVEGDLQIDIEEASDGLFGPDVIAILDSWQKFRGWAGSATTNEAEPLDRAGLLAPVSRPRQVFGIGLNYQSHAAESGSDAPEFPTTFTKFPTCISGPDSEVRLSGDYVDWEVELVVVIGVEAFRVPKADGWSVVAGVTGGQDISDRLVQLRPPSPQFSLGKSFPGFGPTGPWIVTQDEFEDPNDLALTCSVNGTTMQRGRTSELIFDVPTLVESLSSVTTLLPGDLIFTGTPAGVGAARNPPQFLQPGDELMSEIQGVGTLHTRFLGKDC